MTSNKSEFPRLVTVDLHPNRVCTTFKQCVELEDGNIVELDDHYKEYFKEELYNGEELDKIFREELLKEIFKEFCED